jgi:hypothetical protein
MMTAIMARANKEIRNGVKLPRKDYCIQETKKSYTREHPVSITPGLFYLGSVDCGGTQHDCRWLESSKKWRLPIVHGGPPFKPYFFCCFLRYGSALKKMNDDRNHREQQQQVNQRTRNVKYQKPAEPQKQQNYE